MLNRRHLRVKVLQTLYAYYQSEVKDFKPFEKALLDSVDKVHELYIWFLSLLVEIADRSVVDAEERASKYLPTPEDLSVRVKLNENRFIISLIQNPAYISAVKKYKIAWDFDPEVSKSAFDALKNTAEYAHYLHLDTHSIESDKEIIKFIVKKIALKLPGIVQIFEEKFINWPVDKVVLQALVAKTLKNFSNENPLQNKLASVCPNWIEDRPFIIDLFLKTITFESEYQQLIAGKTKNWETDRIAMMDILLMRMAITEILHFPSIPVKVTINEYIEISKEFSTPKSNLFINGILDKVLFDLKKEGKVRKSDRGLIE
ncbi:MAG: transcription antitermination factor NusB [Sphingobacteriaceae bacterium]|nr:MAG: transcription antitermination factor NusB [Pedobacter sp.]